MAASRASGVQASASPASTSAAPAMRSAWSYWIRSHRWITISFRIPVVSGRRPIRSGSLPAMHAAAASRSPPAEPEVTWAPSMPTRRAMCAPARRFSSAMSTKAPAASVMASRTGLGISEPLAMVFMPRALTIGRTPSRV